MKNQKIITSSNGKKGILFEIKKTGVSVSVWKKETPVSALLDKESAMEICEYLSSNIKLDKEVNEKEREEEVSFWAKRIDDMKNSHLEAEEK